MSDSAIDLDHFRARLVRLRAELREALPSGSAGGDTVELDQQRQGRLSRMDALGARAMAQAAGRRRRETPARCEAALQRIDDGDYGCCVRCDGDVDPRRLDFDPTVALCLDCASAAER